MKSRARKRSRELIALAALPDSKIDTSDIPEITGWSRAVVGRFYRPIKRSVTVRLDADVLAWLKSSGRGYQTRLNQLLRRAMAGQPSRRRRGSLAGSARSRS